MIDLLLNPGFPAYLISIAGMLLAVAGMRSLMPQTVGLLPTPSGWPMRTRLLVGQLAGVVIIALLLVVLVHTSSTLQMVLVGSMALAGYMYFGFVLPRKPLVQAEKRRHQLRLLTPGFISYVRIALAGYESPAQLLERYTARIDKRTTLMREVTSAALEVMQRQRQRPFAALRDQARITGCRELIDLSEALAQAEAEGAPIDKVLQQHEQILLAILDDEFKRMLKRRTMYLLLMVAISVVVGVLGNLLYVMVGSALLSGTL
jgi:hypothetical protein